MDSQRYDIAVSYFIRGQFERAARLFAELLAEGPAEPRLWTYYGMSCAHLGRSAEAEQALSKAIELTPRNSEAWFHLGVARGMRREWSTAASAYRYAVALAPDDLVAWHRLGVALAESGDEPASEAAFERALLLSRETGAEGEAPAKEDRQRPPDAPDDHMAEPDEPESEREAKSWIDLALSLLSLGEEEEAIAAYERAFTLDPGRAQRSLFKPMLRLIASAAQEGDEEDPRASPSEDRPVRPRPGVGPVEPDLTDLGPDVP